MVIPYASYYLFLIEFVSPPPAPAVAAFLWHAGRPHRSGGQTRFVVTEKIFASDDISDESEEEDHQKSVEGELSPLLSSDCSNHPSSKTAKKHRMGTSIGAQNVGEMLFNTELLKSGRGDIRVDPMRRWKDFRGNEIVPDTDNAPN